jgi:hypothetical protein
MSGPTNRKSAPRAWHPDRTFELLELLANIQRHQQVEEETRRQRDVRGELAARMRPWFAEELGRLYPAADQPRNTVLGDRVGLPLTGELIDKSTGTGQMQIYAALTKAVEQPDGSLRVWGVASTEDLDDQNEIVRADAVREAIPDYMRFPCLREMHGLAAAGTTLELAVGDDNVTRIIGRVVDEQAIKKIKSGTYRGFSLGGAVLEREASNPRAISRLKLTEISLVDRPANAQATFTMWKASAPMEQPAPYWDCGKDHRHPTREDAVWCRVRWTMEKAMKQSKSDKRLQKALRKRVGIPDSPGKAAAQILSRPIVPDSSDVQKRAQGFPDFVALYYAGRQQLVDQRFTTRR